MLRPSHLKQVAAILDDPEATDNDRLVALTLLRNAEIAARGILPMCQDTGTAIVIGKKGQQSGPADMTRKPSLRASGRPSRRRTSAIPSSRP